VNVMKLCLHPTHRHRAGFTLIELLIVIAIIAISGAAIEFSITRLMRESAFLERSMAMQSESILTLEALTRDLGRAQKTVSVLTLPPNPAPPFDPTADPDTLIARAPGSEEAILTLDPAPAEAGQPAQRIEYHLRDGVLERRFLPAPGLAETQGATRHTQTLARSVESLTFKREGELLAVDIRFASCPTDTRYEQRVRTEFYLGEIEP